VDMQYAITRFPTPVFNTPDISACFGGEDGDTLALDDQNLLRTVETVLFPHSKIALLDRIGQSFIRRIITDEYNYEGSYYIDERFVKCTPDAPLNRSILIPDFPTMIAKLDQLVGTRYIWGGNWPLGIDLLPKLYPSRTPLHQLSRLIQDTWYCRGLDCSGLFHYVSEGYTARNTSRLVHFGHAVDIEGLDIDKMMCKVNKLDLIVWEGHVLGVFDEHTVIESKPVKGVVKVKLSDRLAEIMRDRKAVNHWNNSKEPRFVIRRWHPEVSAR
jgi:hypothetical protein